MSSIVKAWVSLAGDIKENKTAVGVALSQKITCGAGKRWMLFGGMAHITQNATTLFELFNELDEIIMQLGSFAAGTGNAPYPSDSAIIGRSGNVGQMIPMEAGWYVKCTFGANQDAAAYITAIILEVAI